MMSPRRHTLIMCQHYLVLSTDTLCVYNGCNNAVPVCEETIKQWIHEETQLIRTDGQYFSAYINLQREAFQV
jgi:hypothetical protein